MILMSYNDRFYLGSNDATDRLQQIFKPILSSDVCTQQLGPLFDKTTMLCSGIDGGGVGACSVRKYIHFTLTLNSAMFTRLHIYPTKLKMK
jgi:hypothetical protein